MITPEGYGFSTPASRVLSESSRNGGFYRANVQESVIDVMGKISDGSHDVALVFDDETQTLLGLFTETDYIRFSTERAAAAANETDSARLLMTSIAEYVTPAESLIALAPTETVNVAIPLMKQNNVRHLIVADKVADRKINQNSQIMGVISMQDVMSVIQKDERLSLQALQAKYPYIRNPLDRFREELRSEANLRASDPETAKRDVIRFGTAVLAALVTAGFFSSSAWLHDHADLAMIAIFVAGYIGIIFEEVFEFNKAGIALLMSTGLWVAYADYFNSPTGTASSSVLEQLGEQLAEVSDICFFLLAASAIVEVIDSHQGFKVVTDKINTSSKKELFWTIGFLTFFLSSILNNLTVTIVMVSLLRKLIPNDEDRRMFGAMVVSTPKLDILSGGLTNTTTTKFVSLYFF